MARLFCAQSDASHSRRPNRGGNRTYDRYRAYHVIVEGWAKCGHPQIMDLGHAIDIDENESLARTICKRCWPMKQRPK